jgi:Domain of unknown function (DUF6924)
MKKIGKTKNSLLLRTHFGDDAAWRALCAAITKPVGSFRAYVSPLSDPAYDGVGAKQIARLVSPDHHPFVLVADRVAVAGREHAVLVVDTADHPGRSFRVVPSEAWSVENNLSIANMDFDEFAHAVAKDGVFRGFSEIAGKKPKKTSLAKMRPLERTQALALRGRIDDAKRELLALRARGDRASSASLAEIAAYEGHWDTAMRHAEVILASPGVTYSGNVYDDMLWIVGLAGRALRAWPEVLRIAKLADKKLVDKTARGNLIRGVRTLAAFAKRKGKGRLLPWIGPTPTGEKDLLRCLRAIEKKNTKFDSAVERRDHLLAMAAACQAYDGVLELYDAEKRLPSDSFDVTVFLASALARRGRTREAWNAIRAKLRHWWPVEYTQIAPIQLLTDEGIGPLMTNRRCAAILTMPRGPEGPAGS